MEKATSKSTIKMATKDTGHGEIVLETINEFSSKLFSMLQTLYQLKNRSWKEMWSGNYIICMTDEFWSKWKEIFLY